MTYGIKELDRSGGFYIRNYFGVKIIMSKHPMNPLIRAYAIWAIRHPNKKMRE
jgi:hypothetical protein